MISEYLPFTFYLMVGCWLIYSRRLFKLSGIPSWVMMLVFCLKVAVGVLYGLYFNLPKQRTGADTWRFFKESFYETDLLKQHPFEFVQSLFVHGYQQQGNLFVGSNSYWNDLKENVVIKFIAICNLLTGTQYYADVVLFNFCFMVGLDALYKTIKSQSSAPPAAIFASVFLLPSTLFWGSGLHKDGLLISAIGVLMYCFQRQLVQKRWSIHTVWLILSFLFIFAIKNFVALAIFPALLAWWLAERNKQRYQYYFIAVYCGGLLLMMMLSVMHPSLNALKYIANKQQEFLQLSGNSAIPVPPLLPTLESVFHYLPTAIDVAFFRPHLFEIKNPAYALSFMENIGYACVVIAFIWFTRNKRRLPPFYTCCLFFSLSILLLDGFTVTFTGAIVRYRSLMLPFLIGPMVAMLPFKRWLWVAGNGKKTGIQGSI